MANKGVEPNSNRETVTGVLTKVDWALWGLLAMLAIYSMLRMATERSGPEGRGLGGLAALVLLVLLAASVGTNGIAGLAVWTAIVLAAYVIGLSFIAQKESTHIALRLWPMLFLLAPLLLAGIINTEPFQKISFLLALVLIGWLLRSLYFAFWAAHRNVGRCGSSLLAGIAFGGHGSPESTISQNKKLSGSPLGPIHGIQDDPTP